MRRLLLDTCVALWYFEGSKRLSVPLLETLTDPQNSLYFSDVSFLEIVIKHQLGKLQMRKKPSILIPHLIKAHSMELLPIASADICCLESLPLHHRDPFDRLLVAQSLARRLTLVSSDPQLRHYAADLYWQ